MRLHKSQHGIAALGGLVVLVLVAAIVGTGWYVYVNSQTANNESGTAIESAPVQKSDAPQITSTADLDKATETLDAQEIDANLDTSGLDEDLNSIF